MITLGCIADDFTGGTDVAAAVRRSGMSVSLLFDIPQNTSQVPATDAVVIALKTRTIPAADAVAQSLAALSWLQVHDVDRVYFKYCSTFDSTEKGNIGPVADALLDALVESMTLVCPASPEHDRTMYRGHLFVGDDLLSESSMRHHPLTPMTDSRIPRVMQAQTVGAIGLLSLDEVRSGAATVNVRLKELAAAKVRHVVVDAIDSTDLDVAAAGSRNLRLYTGGAGLAGALAKALGTPGDLSSAVEQRLPTGPGVVLAGSCSAATLAQVATAAEVFPSYRLDPVATPDPGEMLTKASEWLRANWGKGPVLIYSSAGPEDRERARAAMGPRTSDLLEQTLGALAKEAVALGAARVVVAGGETSGAVVQSLDIDTVVIDSEADRGVPWCLTVGERPLALLLKSGNFGANDLLVRSMLGTGR